MKSAYQAIPFGRWCAPGARTRARPRLELPFGEAAVEHRAEDERPFARARARWRRRSGPSCPPPPRGSGSSSRPPSRRSARAAAFSCGSRSGCVSGIRYGLAYRSRIWRPTKTAAAGIHQKRGSRWASPIAISTAALSSRKMKARSEPAAEDHGAVTLVGLVVAPLPPEREHLERNRDQPGQAESEHREHHPGADRAGCGLAREARSAPGVEREDDDRRDGLAEDEPVEERFVVLGPVDQARGEELPLREARQVQAVGHARRRPEEVGGGAPTPRRAQLRLRAALAPTPCASPSSPTSTLTCTRSRRYGKRSTQEAPDEIWCLGDLVGYGPQPDACCAWSAGHTAVCLAGNHDLGVLGTLDITDFSDDAAAAAIWTRGVLGEPRPDISREAARRAASARTSASSTRARVTRYGSTC